MRTSRPGRQHSGRIIRLMLLALLVMGAVSACRAFSPRTTQSAPAGGPPPSTEAMSKVISITGPGGRELTDAERKATLQRVAAQGRAALMKQQLAAMARFGDVGLYNGNRVSLLIDGPATFEAMFKAIREARRSILLESYIVEDARIARELAALLKARRAEGLEVALIYDAVGSIGTDQAFFDGLQSAGVMTCKFNPVNPLERPGYWGISHRDHRKILVVDEHTGFTGGINIGAVYSSGSFGARKRRAAPPPEDAGWRDTQVEIEGPAAGALADMLRETWRSQGCKGSLRTPPPPQKSAGGQLVRILPSSPDDEYNRIYELLLSTIQASSESVHMTMAYFAPGREMLDALTAAARRGVDVTLILPSRSDFAPILHAGRAYYSEMLAAGVRIYELQDAVLHAKTLIVDGVVSTVGSTNMDWRSFVSNNEVNAVVIGEDFASRMHEVFERDLGESQRITAEAWSRRSWLQRVREFAASLFEPIW